MIFVTTVEGTDNDLLAEGRRYPETVDFWPDDNGPWKVTFQWVIVDGVPACTQIVITSTNGDLPIPEGVIRELRLGERMRRRRAEIVTQTGSPAASRPRGMRTSTLERLKIVAQLYKEAYEAGESTSRAVIDGLAALGITTRKGTPITRGAASSLVAQARAAGLLPPTSRGAAQG